MNLKRLLAYWLNRLAPPMAADISTLDQWDGVGHKHRWEEYGPLVYRCRCGVRVPRDD